MKISLLHPRILNKNIMMWDNADGIACSGFYNIFKDTLLKNNDYQWIEIDNGINIEEYGQCLYDKINYIKDSDIVLRIGSPAWFNEYDIIVYDECIKNNIPFALIGIGVGCKWDIYEWHIFHYKYKDLLKIFQSEQCKGISCRDPNCYSLFSQLQLKNLLLNGCLGYFSLENKIRDSKENVLIEILDYDTLKNNALYSEEEIDKYYKTMSEIYEYFKFNSNCKLMVQRISVIGHYEKNSDICIFNSDQTSEHNKKYFLKYFANEFFNLALSYNAFSNLMLEADVLITSRIHGALPMAGSGGNVFGIGIDNRQFTWSLFPTIQRFDARTFSLKKEDVINWYNNINIEKNYVLQLNLRNEYKYLYENFIDDIKKNNIKNKKSIQKLDYEEIVTKYLKGIEKAQKSTDDYDIFWQTIKYIANDNNLNIYNSLFDNMEVDSSVLIVDDFAKYETNSIVQRLNELIKKTKKYVYIVNIGEYNLDSVISKFYNTNSINCQIIRYRFRNPINRYLNNFFCLTGRK